MDKSWIARCVFIALTAQATTVMADTLAKVRESATLVIAHRESSLPFSYFDENKRPVGYAIDLCLRLAEGIKNELKLTRLDVQYLPVNPSTRMPAIAEGRADIECGSTTNTAERRQKVAFTVSHFIASARMLVRTDSGIRNWVDLLGKKIVTTKGTTNAKTLTDRDKVRALSIKLVESKDHGDSFAMVVDKQADAFAMDDVLLYGLRASAANPADFRVVGDSLSTEPYAIMLRKDDVQFKRVLDREMARIIDSGEIFRLYDKWFTQPIPPKGLNMNMPMGYLLRDTLRFPTDKVAD